MPSLSFAESDKAPIMHGADMVYRAIFRDLSSAFPVVPAPLVAHKVSTAAPDRQQVVETSMAASQPLVETEAEEAEEAARDVGEEEEQLDMGQAKSEAAARLAEDEAQAAESVQAAVAAVVVCQEEEDTAGSPPASTRGQRKQPQLTRAKVSAAGDCCRASWSPARVTHSQSAIARSTKTS